MLTAVLIGGPNDGQRLPIPSVAPHLMIPAPPEHAEGDVVTTYTPMVWTVFADQVPYAVAHADRREAWARLLERYRPENPEE